MAYKSKSKTAENPKLEMTPMIDVVFQLLIFFVVTLKQEDIMSQLSAARPAHDQKADKENPPKTIDVLVAPQGFIFNGRLVRLEELNRNIERLSGYSKTSMILIKCTADSPHAMLIQVLDVCNRHGMTNLSIFSI
jgi:Biopolymer transport protein